MADTVRLMHTHMRGDRMFYFYDAETQVEGGIISLTTDHPERIQRAWVMGYRLDPETGTTLSLADALAAQTARDSSEEQDEDTDSGRQSGPDNGVRESEPDSAGNADTSESSSSVRGGARKSRARKANTRRSKKVPAA